MLVTRLLALLITGTAVIVLVAWAPAMPWPITAAALAGVGAWRALTGRVTAAVARVSLAFAAAAAGLAALITLLADHTAGVDGLLAIVAGGAACWALEAALAPAQAPGSRRTMPEAP